MSNSNHTRQAAARFDRWAGSYGNDRLAPWFHYYQSLALSRLEIEDGTSFLEVGCGTGWAVREAAKRNNDGVSAGIDISPRMIDAARSQSGNGEAIQFRVADAQSIPYPSGTFDSVLCTNSFHHYPDPVAALREIRRVMKQDGRFVLLDSARDISFGIWLQDRFRRHFERSHVRYYTTAELRRLIEASDLRLQNEPLTIKRFAHHGKLFTGLMMWTCAR